MADEMTSLGFVSGQEYAKVAQKQRRIILAIDGKEKVGKTRFCLTAPGPIAFFNIDLGTEGVLDVYCKENPKKKVYIQTFHVRMLEGKEGQDAALVVWQRLITAYRAVLGKVRTVVIDTSTELWDIVRLAAFGKLSQVKSHHYGPVNSQFRDFIRMAYDSNTNLILIHKLKDEYENDKKTGRLVRGGFSDTGFMVQANATLSKDPKAESIDEKFKLLITDCRQNTNAEGTELVGPFCNFPFLAQTIMPYSDPGDWEDS